MVEKGRAWVFGDDLQGDYHLIPYPKIREIFDPKQLAQHCMVNVDPEFPAKVQPGDIVVGGRNFGCGVVHPHALMAFKGLGINLVIAEGIARETIPAHALQEGLAMMEMPGVTAVVRTGDVIEVDVGTGMLKNHTTGRTFRGTGLPQVFIDRLEAGGLVPYIKKRLAAARGSQPTG